MRKPRNPEPDPAGSVSYDTVRRLALALPEAEEKISRGFAAFHVRGKLFARMREGGDTLVVKMHLYERALVMEAEPDIFYLGDSYHDHPYVLVRLSAVRPARLRELLEDAWRLAAPGRMVADYDRRSPSG